MAIDRTPHNIRIAYGAALEAAGLMRAIQVIDQLLDDQYQEKFGDYFPAAAAFRSFKRMFARTRRSVPESWGWAVDEELIKPHPGFDESLRHYFDAVFAPAVRP